MNVRFLLLGLLVMLFCLTIQDSEGQSISINRADAPVAGDTLRFSMASTSSMSIDSIRAGGANRVWQFGQLRAVSQEVAAYRSAAQISFAYGLFFGFASFGRKIADTIGAGDIQARDVYDFYRNTASAFSVVGRGLSFGGLPLASNFIDSDEIYRFPLNYSDNDSGTYRVVFTVPGVGSWSQTGRRRTQADGWGSITTPYGTFNCLRVKQTVVQQDSLMPDQFHIPISFSTETVTYQWLAQGQHYPILEVVVAHQFGAQQIASVNYRDVKRVILPAPPRASFFSVRRTLSAGDSALLFNLSQPAQSLTYNWQITPSAGVRFAAGTSATSATPIVAFALPGLYSVRLTATNAAGTDDSLITDYIRVNDPVATKLAVDDSPWLAPNPAMHQVQVALPGQGWLVQLVDAKGRTAKAFFTDGTPVGLRGVASGLYTVIARKGVEVHTQQLVIEK